jgi:putative oxidoreductase
VTAADLALLLLRVALGGIYVAHGARKLGWRNPSGLPGFLASIDRRGYRPAWFWAAAAIGAEVLGGVLAIIGLLSPIAGALLLAQSVTIVALVRERGFWVEEMGIEYPLMLGTASLALAFLGPGGLSLDGVLGIRFAPALAVALTAVAVGGALAGLALRRPPRPA